MTKHPYPRLAAIGVLFLALLCAAVAAQEATGSAGSSPPVTARLLETKLAEAEAAADLPEEAKAKLVSLYREALGNLKEAASYRESAEAFRQALRTAPIEAQAIREDIEEPAVPVEPSEVDGSTELSDMEALLQRNQRDLASAEEAQEEFSKRLDEQPGRSEAIRQRLKAAAEEGAEIDARLALPATDADGKREVEAQARRWVLETRKEALTAEIDMLEREIQSQPARAELLAANRDKAASGAARIEQRISRLHDLLTAKRQSVAEQAKREAEAARLDAEGAHPPVARLAEQNAALSEEIAETLAQLDELEAQTDETQRLARQLEDDFDTAEEIIAIGGSRLSQELGNLLLQQRQSLPDLRSFEHQAREREARAGQIGVRRLLHRREQKRLSDPAAYAAGLLTPAMAEETPSLRKRLVDLATERKALLERAIESEDVLLRKLRELAAAQEDLLGTIARFDEFLDVHLLWVRSASRAELEELGALPDQVWRIISPAGWYGATQVLVHQATHSPVFVLLALVLGALLWSRRRLIAFVESTAAKVGKPTTDKFLHSLQALAVTLVAAAALPLVAAVVGWQLQASPEATGFSSAVGGALLALAVQFYLLRAFRLICMPRGVAAAHFRWPEPNLRLL